MKKLSVLFLIVASASYGTLLQEAIDRAPSGSTLKLASGTYPGAIIIDKPITIIGKEDGVIIKGDNLGSVVTISSSHVILKNLTITGSGGRMENLDSAITIKSAKACEISHCRILDSLYGIDLAMVDDSVIADNYITSKKNEIAFRGDALKIWYCNHNLIKNNTIERTRDVTLAYSNNNTIENNHFFYNRFALHLSMSKQNSVKNNHFQYNSVAVMVMGAKDTEIVNNSIKSCRGAAGIGVVLKGVSNLLFENNIVSFNAEGLYIDSTGGEEGMQRYIKNNEISYNKEAIHFHAEIKNNTMTHNRIFGNIDDVVKGAW
ncbi:MAG: right-handed parallel beta-helix repeat-containing protein, partial [Thiovulaceae bacterium]|nr:right-handed parallel beta-helix repeat-containing protein [Sulfurimonadaceae bacterium]